MGSEAAELRFIADAMLGRLAKSLRILGYDVSYASDIEDAALKLAAVREGRVVLTRDSEVAATGLPVRVVLVESDHHREQLLQVIRELRLPAPRSLFSRCLICNVPVEDVPRADVKEHVPPYVFATQKRFARCPGCGRIYWPATHVANAAEWLDELMTAEGRAAATNVFVTGRPGVGKTTLIRSVLDSLGPCAGGFYTSEIREGGRRVGFAIRDLRGVEGVLAHVDLESPHRVGRYGVNREDLERVGVRALLDAVGSSELVVMDEIGRMELCSDAFQRAVNVALDSPTPVLGTLQDRHNAFLDAVRAREDVEIVRITETDRDPMAAVVLEKVRALLHASRRAAEEQSE